MSNTFQQVHGRIDRANERYGALASTHEGMGVALEEWHELNAAVHSNDMVAVFNECIDLAAVVIRMAQQIQDGGTIIERSTK